MECFHGFFWMELDSLDLNKRLLIGRFTGFHWRNGFKGVLWWIWIQWISLVAFISWVLTGRIVSLDYFSGTFPRVFIGALVSLDFH